VLGGVGGHQEPVIRWAVQNHLERTHVVPGLQLQIALHYFHPKFEFNNVFSFFFQRKSIQSLE
jgi:hypothetical protein